jgi:hypothetical protein
LIFLIAIFDMQAGSAWALVCILFFTIPNLRRTRLKTILAVATIAALSSCSSPQEFQAEMISAELVKIDTAFRYSSPGQMLTWRDDHDVNYVTYAPLNNVFLLGSKMIVLVKR